MTQVFGKVPSRTLNAKECVSRGAALQCAMLSPVFKVIMIHAPGERGASPPPATLAQQLSTPRQEGRSCHRCRHVNPTR